MKNTIFAFLLVMAMAGIGRADGVYFQDSALGPVISSGTAYAGVSAAVQTVYAAPGAGKYNCLTDLYIVSNATFTFRILNGATTGYAALHAANIIIDKSWNDKTAWCAAANSQLTISVDDGSAFINSKGFVGK